MLTGPDSFFTSLSDLALFNFDCLCFTGLEVSNGGGRSAQLRGPRQVRASLVGSNWHT